MRRLTWGEVLEQQEPKTRRRRVAYVLGGLLSSFKKKVARNMVENWQLIRKILPEVHEQDCTPGRQRSLLVSITSVLKKKTPETAELCAVVEHVGVMLLERFGKNLVIPFDRLLEFASVVSQAINELLLNEKGYKWEELERKVRLIDLSLGMLGKTIQGPTKGAFSLFVSTLLKPLAITQAKLKLVSHPQNGSPADEEWSKTLNGISENADSLLCVVLFNPARVPLYKLEIWPKDKILKRMKGNDGTIKTVVTYVSLLFEALEKDMETNEQYLVKWAGPKLVRGYVNALRTEASKQNESRRFHSDRELRKRLREDTLQRNLEFSFFKRIATIVTKTSLFTQAAVKVFSTLVELRLFQTNRDPAGEVKRKYLEESADRCVEFLDDHRFDILTTLGELDCTFLDKHLGKLILYATAKERRRNCRVKFTDALVACYTPRCLHRLLKALLEAMSPQVVLDEIASAFEVHAAELANQQREELWRQLLTEKATSRNRSVVIRMIAAILSASIQTSNRAGRPSEKVPTLLSDTVKAFLVNNTIESEPHLLKLVIAVLRIWINCRACGIEGLPEIPLPGPKVVGKYLEESNDELAVPETLCLINLLKQRLAGLDAADAPSEHENWDSVFEAITQKITERREVVAMLTSSDLQGLLLMISKPETREKLLKLILEIVAVGQGGGSMLADVEFYEIQELRELWVPVVARILGSSAVEDQRAVTVFEAISNGCYKAEDLVSLHQTIPKVNDKGRALMEVLISLPDGYLPSTPSVIPLLLAAEICGCLEASVARGSVLKLLQTDHLVDGKGVQCLQWMFTHCEEDCKEVVLKIWRSIHQVAARMNVWESLSDLTKTWLVEPNENWLLGMKASALEGQAAWVSAEINRIRLLEKRGAEKSELSIPLAYSTLKLLAWPEPEAPDVEKMETAKVKLITCTLTLRRVCAHRFCRKLQPDLTIPSWESEKSYLQDVVWPLANKCLSPEWIGTSEDIIAILQLVNELLFAPDLPRWLHILVLQAMMRFGLKEFENWDPETGIDPPLTTILRLVRTCIRMLAEKIRGKIFWEVKAIIDVDPSPQHQRLFALQVIIDVLNSKVNWNTLKSGHLTKLVTSAVRLTNVICLKSQRALLRFAVEVMMKVISCSKMTDRVLNLCLTVLSPLHAESVKLLQSDADLLSLQARFLCGCLKHCPNEVYFAAHIFLGIVRQNFLTNAIALANHSTQVARVLSDLGRSEHKNAFKRYFPMLLADFMHLAARNPLPLEGRRVLTPSIKNLFSAAEENRMEWMLAHLDQQSRDYLQDFRS